MNLTLPIADFIKTTTSLCPHCKRQIAAEVIEKHGQVYLRKHCPDHGLMEVLINSARRFYYLSEGADGACQCHAGHSETMVEQAATCIALIELVESCNLKCPTCYADSPFSRPEEIKCLSVEEFWRRIEAMIERKGPLDILQLSGGEPTIHPRFFEILERVLTHPKIGYTLINTNGVLLAADDNFVERLGELHRGHRKFEIYLQFDGTQEGGQMALRGADFRRLREQAIERTGRYEIPTTLAMTVTQDNLAHLGDTLRFGLAHDSIRGITFQPMFGSGRTHWDSPLLSLGLGEVGLRETDVVRTPLSPPLSRGEVISPFSKRENQMSDGNRLNLADVILALVAQSEELLSERDFTPLPCGDPNCHTIGYLLRRNGQTHPVSHFIDFANVQGFLKDRVNFDFEDLKRCGCESEPLGHILKALEIGPDHVFRIFIKPFMDVWTYDQDRIDRCCVHVVGENGKLESFCRHYAMKS